MPRRTPRTPGRKVMLTTAPKLPGGPRRTRAKPAAAPKQAHLDEPADTETRPYTVGFKRPSKEHSFKPGQSGNPKGRPKGSKNNKTIMKDVFEEKISIRIGGRVRRMPALKALALNLRARAFQNDDKALNSLMLVARQFGYGADQNESDSVSLPIFEYEEIVDDFLRRRHADNPPTEPRPATPNPKRGR